MCPRLHKARLGTDPHSQCLCYRTSPQGTTALRQQDLTDWSWYHWIKHKPFPQSQHFNDIHLDEEFLAVWERQELRSSIPAFKNYIPFLIWDPHPEQPPLPPKSPQEPNPFLQGLSWQGCTHYWGQEVFISLALRATQCVSLLLLTAILSSNTQTKKPRRKSASFQSIAHSNTHLQVHGHIKLYTANIQTNSSNSELHLHLETSVFSVTCDDQNLQVPKLFYPRHPVLPPYNVWEASNLPAVVVITT